MHSRGMMPCVLVCLMPIETERSGWWMGLRLRTAVIELQPVRSRSINYWTRRKSRSVRADLLSLLRQNTMLPSEKMTLAPKVALEAFADTRPAQNTRPYDYQRFLAEIVDVYDSKLIRAYCKARFMIININILQMLGLCLRGRKRILDVGCGFGLFGCYLSAMYPDVEYRGYDLNSGRIEKANRAAQRLGLTNVSFRVGDARDLEIEDEYDAIMMVDLLHHIDDQAKATLLDVCSSHLAPDGRLVIKDVTRRPFHKIA